jgi:1,4-dihydroxy-2-naphthoate polyprenyltransferase
MFKWLFILARAARAPFLTVFIVSFVYGSLIEKGSFRPLRFWLGLGTVLFSGAAANLFNDYVDSKSRADWQDARHYQFFGGSKLIQKGIRSEGFFLASALASLLLAVLSVSALVLVTGETKTLVYYALIIFLAYSYSGVPFRLSYRRLGEPVIFLLFGPAIIMGAYFIQTGIFPSAKSFYLSLPFGFLTAALLFANEIPDFPQDIKVSKRNWVGIVGPEKAYVLYGLIAFPAFAAVILNVASGRLARLSLLSLFCLPLCFAAGSILKKDYRNKDKLVVSSFLTLLVHHLTALILIFGLIL